MTLNALRVVPDAPQRPAATDRAPPQPLSSTIAGEIAIPAKLIPVYGHS